jgi:ABC-type uncharacterized transport system permease subunit
MSHPFQIGHLIWRNVMRWIIPVFLAVTFATSAFAQNAPAPAEVQGEPISLLMFFTLGGAALIAVGLFVWFLRKRSNREAADRALNPNNPANR